MLVKLRIPITNAALQQLFSRDHFRRKTRDLLISNVHVLHARTTQSSRTTNTALHSRNFSNLFQAHSTLLSRVKKQTINKFYLISLLRVLLATGGDCILSSSSRSRTAARPFFTVAVDARPPPLLPLGPAPVEPPCLLFDALC